MKSINKEQLKQYPFGEKQSYSIQISPNEYYGFMIAFDEAKNKTFLYDKYSPLSNILKPKNKFQTISLFLKLEYEKIKNST